MDPSLRWGDVLRWLTGLLFLLAASAATAQTFPQLSGRVVDQAHLLTPAQVQDLTSKSEALEAQKGAQLVVATVNSLEGYPSRTMAIGWAGPGASARRARIMVSSCWSRPTSIRCGSRSATARHHI
jgi:Beta-propeller domains of methanol dehydrogenase type